MRVFISVLILIFSLQSFTKADDIRDFQIEGISVGDSLLDHLEVLDKTKKYILNREPTFYPKSKKFGIMNIGSKNYELYDSIQFSIDPTNFKIYRIDGMIFKSSKNDCAESQRKIIGELEKLLPTGIKFEDEFEPIKYIDKSGESIANGIYLDFPSDDSNVYKDFSDSIGVECYIYGAKHKEETNKEDNLVVVVETKEYRDWLQNKAY